MRRDGRTYLARLGTDILDFALTWSELATRLPQPAFRNPSLGAPYSAWGFSAGVGSRLRSEVLFYKDLRPDRQENGAFSAAACMAESTFSLTVLLAT